MYSTIVQELRCILLYCIVNGTKVVGVKYSYVRMSYCTVHTRTYGTTVDVGQGNDFSEREKYSNNFCPYPYS